LLEVIQELPDAVEKAMLVGHNPALADAAAILCHYHLTDKIEDIRLPTAGLLCFEAAIVHWGDLSFGNATLRWFLTPKTLKAISGAVKN
jgi:phosphohistidine phosphatase